MKHLPLAAAVIAPLSWVGAAMAIDLEPLWDYGNPGLSEQRFRAALEGAGDEDRLILQTQIARTYGLRKDFAAAQATLRAIEAEVDTAGFEARARYSLELGRTYASATHPPESQTPGTRQQAKAAYERALQTARAGQLDELAIDSIHMLAFVDSSPAEQLRWGQQALLVAVASKQPAAKKWEASIRHNVGYALHQLGRYPEALDQFQQAAELREKVGKGEALRTAHWMVAWTLRALQRSDEALAIQLRLEQECAAAGQPDPYVFEELEILYRAQGDTERAAAYALRHKASLR